MYGTGIMIGTTQTKRRALRTETSLIATCCVCGLLRGKKTNSQHPDRWVTRRAYEQTYGVSLVGSLFTHTYCSGCLADFMQRAKPEKQSLVRITLKTK